MTTHWIDRDVAAQALPLPVSTIDRVLVGETAPMRQLKRMIAAVAVSDAAVLVRGPTGAGKELVAEAIHRASGRKGALIAVNCAAIPAERTTSVICWTNSGRARKSFS
jgi:sigma-54 specific flagellar transcriptional regulator A